MTDTKVITAAKLAERYGVTKPTMLNFFRDNLDKINADGVTNAYQDGAKKSWYFKPNAVRIIDDLRQAEVISVYRADKLASDNELLNQIKLLQADLLRQ